MAANFDGAYPFVRFTADHEIDARRQEGRCDDQAPDDSGFASESEHDKNDDENSKRRSIYFTVKRSRLMNSMVVFDAPEPLVSQGNRPTTTVAPQALLLLNSPQARGWARGLAERIASDLPGSASVSALVARGYERALSRPPTSAETAAATVFLESGEQQYRDAGSPDARARALADFCQALLGLNEFIYVD